MQHQHNGDQFHSAAVTALGRLLAVLTSRIFQTVNYSLLHWKTARVVPFIFLHVVQTPHGTV